MHLKKHHRKARQKKFWKRVYAICNLHLCYRYKKNAFSQSDMHDFQNHLHYTGKVIVPNKSY